MIGPTDVTYPYFFPTNMRDNNSFDTMMKKRPRVATQMASAQPLYSGISIADSNT